MDYAYDRVQESALPAETAESDKKAEQQQGSLNNDFQEAYRAISSSPWGARLGGFFGSVVKQGEHVLKEAQQEFKEVSEEASKGLTSLQSTLASRTRALSTVQSRDTGKSEQIDEVITPTGEKAVPTDKEIQESEGVLARLQAEAAKRLKEIQKAEDAADEALLKFGTNIRNFLRDAVQVSAPSSDQKDSTILFESKDSSGKRVIHTTRFDAQIHVIHSSLDSFTKEPVSGEYESWTKEFDVEKKTEDIAEDLEKYDELRTAMDKLVPEQVAYADFWRRYYFLRHSIETAEARRKDLLLASAAAAEEEPAWDEDSDDEDKSKTPAKPEIARPASVESATTIHPPKQADDHLRPTEPRKSHDEKSQADSDASYDVVGDKSGAPSQAPGSPKESKKAGDESEEEDWE